MHIREVLNVTMLHVTMLCFRRETGCARRGNCHLRAVVTDYGVRRLTDSFVRR